MYRYSICLGLKCHIVRSFKAHVYTVYSIGAWTLGALASVKSVRCCPSHDKRSCSRAVWDPAGILQGVFVGGLLKGSQNLSR